LQLDGTPIDPFGAGRALLSPEEPRGTVELTVLRDDGEQRVVRCAHAGAFGPDGTLLRDVVIVHDVTRERQVERLKADFIATVSHELRTPITPIKGYADLLRRRGDAMSPEKRAECLEVISSRTEHLARLVEDLLLASRISATEGAASAQVEMGTADLVGLITRACGDFGTDGERIELTLPSEPVHVGCDPMRVVQVLSNLVGNALKYAPTSAVHITVEEQPDRLMIHVTDDGPGIPIEHLERIFDRFERLDHNHVQAGTGLGLYISRQLARAMGGHLTVESDIDQGATFTLDLPAEVHLIAVG
jgi:signal transduction histidine kinase